MKTAHRAALAVAMLTVLDGWAPTAIASADEGKKIPITLELHGYYRARGANIKNLFPIDPNAFAPEPGIRSTSFIMHRLRLEPTIRLLNMVKLHMQIDALDGVIWGDNAGLSSVGLFSTAPSSTPRSGASFATGEGLIPSIAMKRAWIEVALPVGLLRVGRMPSSWGMGLLANGGDGFDDDFGENHFGSTTDRILVATKPISIFKSIRGDDNTDHPFTIAYAYDKIVTTPLEVSLGVDPTRRLNSNAWLSRTSDSDLDGLVDEDPIDGLDNDMDGEEDEDGPGSDDVNEHVFVAIWNQPNAWIVSREDELKLGVYLVYREQRSTESSVWIVDVYGKVLIGSWYAEAEWLAILGKSKAIALGNRDKKLGMHGGVFRFGHLGKMLHVVAELGYSEGDENRTDERWTRRPLHPDYNAGLLLYEEILAESTARAWGPDSNGLWSKGGIYSSFYFFPRVRFFPFPEQNLRVIAGVLTAYGLRPDCSTIYSSSTLGGAKTEDDCSGLDPVKKPYLGTELDIAVKYDWFQDHMSATLEFGYLLMGPGLLNERFTADPRRHAWTIQSRIAFIF